MNRRGFTLIEVILVLVIIVMLSLILIPNVMLFVGKNDKDMCNKMKDNFISAAKMYVSENKYELGFSCSNNSKLISLQTLIAAGKLTSPIENPVTKKEVDARKIDVEVTFDCNTRTFGYSVNDEFKCE